MKRFNRLKENSERQLNKLRNKIKEFCTKEVENFKRTSQKFWSWRIQWIQWRMHSSWGNRADQTEERISDLEDKYLEVTQLEEERELRFLKSEDTLWEPLDKIQNTNITITGLPEREEREKGAESVFREIIAKNFPTLGKELEIQVQEPYRTNLSQCKKIFSEAHYNETVKNQW